MHRLSQRRTGTGLQQGSAAGCNVLAALVLAPGCPSPWCLVTRQRPPFAQLWYLGSGSLEGLYYLKEEKGRNVG